MSNSERYKLYKSSNLCPNCGKFSDDGHTFCHECRKKARDRYNLRVYPQGIKKCIDCGVEIGIGSQRKSKRCATCLQTYNLAWSKNYYATHPDKTENVKQYRRKRYQGNKEEISAQKRETTMFRRYGITYSNFVTILNRQNWKCAICGIEFPNIDIVSKKRKTTTIDHDHITGKVRGILCQNCNFGLGNMRDSVETLQNAIRYLIENSDTSS